MKVLQPGMPGHILASFKKKLFKAPHDNCFILKKSVFVIIVIENV